MSEPIVERDDPVETTGLAEENGVAAAPEDSVEEEAPQPLELPVLPLRGLVVYPQTAVPLTVGQARSMKLVDSVVNGDRVICLVASKDPDNETPGPGRGLPHRHPRLHPSSVALAGRFAAPAGNRV